MTELLRKLTLWRLGLLILAATSIAVTSYLSKLDLVGMMICFLIATVLVLGGFFFVVKAGEIAKLIVEILFGVIETIQRRIRK